MVSLSIIFLLVISEFYAYLKTLDVTVSDAQGVFKLLDVNGTGEVNLRRCRGCRRPLRFLIFFENFENIIFFENC